MLLTAFKIKLSGYKTSTTLLAQDVQDQNAWYFPYLNYAKSVSIIYPNLRNELEPGRSLNRAQCAEIIYQMLILKYGGETQKMLNSAEAKLVDGLIQIKNGKIEAALSRAQEAIFYADTALKQEPASTIADAAHNIAHAFDQLFRAYQANLEKNYAAVKTLVAEAKNYAQLAKDKDVSVSDLAKKVSDLGDQLLKKAGL